MSKYIQKDKWGICLLVLATFWSLQAHAQLLVVNPSVLHADWEDGTWYSGVMPIPELNYQYPGEDITTDPDTNRFVEASTNFARSGDFSFRSFGQPPALRSEIAFIETPFQFNIGDETYYSVSYCPDDTWLDTAIYDIILTQWKNFGSGPSAMLRLTNDGNHIPFFRAMDINYYFDPLPLNEWTDFIFFFKWSPGSDGITKIWRNGELVLHLTGRTSLLDGPGYMQMGMYTEIRQPRNIYIDNVRIGDSVFTNQLPAFVTDPISSPKAKANWAYTGSISGSATDPEGPVTYAKVAGPAWLQVAADGTLSGTPGPGDIGPNVFTVRTADNDFGEDTATLNINVVEVHPITVAMDDFQSNSWSGGSGWNDDWVVTTGSYQPVIVLLDGNYSVKLSSGSLNHSITRTLASPVSDGMLTFKWDADSLDSPSEYGYAEVFDGAWHTVWSVNSTGNGGDSVPTPDNLQEASVYLSAFGEVTQIRFSMSSNTSGNDWFFVDDIELRIHVNDAYETWRVGYGLSGADAALLADPDGDGLNNLGEYALGGYPDQADLPPGILPAAHIESFGGDPELYMLYRRRRDAADRDLSYYLDLTGNLDGGTWSTNGYTETGTEVIDADFELVANWIPEVISNGFIRLNIELD